MNHEKIKILIVEDNSPDAFLLVEAFQEFGNGEFELARSVELDTALKRISQERIDAILLDLSLPIFLGLEPLARIHRTRPRIPVFVLSGYNDPDLASEAVKLGAHHYIVKNQLDGNALIKMVRTAVEENRRLLTSQD
jgi:DNA-binding NtrC family response regulator